jgi:hypothetical protein|tara:strand:+ start:138 stop:317 length:180 start_codon:yes stop_codon:yes gene_type:complete
MTTIDKLHKPAVMRIDEANMLAEHLNHTDDWHYKVIHIDEEMAKVLCIDPTDGYEIGYL